MIEDEELIMSPLGQTVEQNHCAVEILIYKGVNDKEWVLELEDEFSNSFVWDDLFVTDKAALNAALEAIDNEGIKSFIGEPAPVPKPQTKEEYAIDLSERLDTTLPMVVTPTKTLIHRLRNREEQAVKLKPRPSIVLEPHP